MTTDDRPLLVGTVVSIAAWFLGYGLTYVLIASDIRESPLNRLIDAFDGEPATYEMVGWVFYNAHFVDTVFRDVPLVGSSTATYIGGEDGFTILLYVIPIGLLLAAGIALARYRGAADELQGALASAAVLPGYLLLSIAGTVLFEVTVAGASAAPDLLSAIVLAGVVYPLVFAGGGGVVGSLLERRERRRRRTSK